MCCLDVVKEYCLREYFVASCASVGDVILMTSALYGRMRIGRCIRGSFNIGCSNDVTAIFDDRCSGRGSCNVSVRSLVDSRPCQRDFASYLEASYRCVPGKHSNFELAQRAWLGGIVDRPLDFRSTGPEFSSELNIGP